MWDCAAGDRMDVVMSRMWLVNMREEVGYRDNTASKYFGRGQNVAKNLRDKKKALKYIL